LQLLAVLLDAHVRVHGARELALRSLDRDHAVRDGDGDALRDVDGTLADPRDAEVFGARSSLGHHQTSQRISPPTFCSRAALSLMTPREVDMIATPRPLWTFGMSR